MVIIKTGVDQTRQGLLLLLFLLLYLFLVELNPIPVGLSLFAFMGAIAAPTSKSFLIIIDCIPVNMAPRVDQVLMHPGSKGLHQLVF